ncbi:MAG: hypothetical protein GXO19_02325 [Epsilonproteobacteria bacterium]|nr:hypothetical protein [Campylobacterota bacterium]NPA56553.1 hypothetical protein [Campylobacterota bacterium]
MLSPTSIRVIVDNSRLDGNSAGSSGGAICAEGARIEVRIQSSTVSGNDASLNGGAIFFSVGDQNALSLSGSAVDSNSAGDDGGGIWISGNGGVDKVWMVNNSAGRRGGSVFVNSSPFVANVAVISNGHAGIGGAGVYAEGNYSVIIKNSTLINNIAPESEGERGDIVVLSKGEDEEGNSPQLMVLNSAVERVHFKGSDQTELGITYVFRNNFIKEAIGISMEELGSSNTQTEEFGYRDVKGGDFSLKGNSPLIGKANKAKSSIEDVMLIPRDSEPDVGAVEYPHQATVEKFKEKLFDTPMACGPTEEDSAKEYEEGFNAGKEYCKENPEECGITLAREWKEMTPREEVIQKLKGKSFQFSGYYIHYDRGTFDWIYVNRDLSIVAKLEEGCGSDGSLRWNYIHVEKTDPAFDSIHIDGDRIFFGDEVSSDE